MVLVPFAETKGTRRAGAKARKNKPQIPPVRKFSTALQRETPRHDKVKSDSRQIGSKTVRNFYTRENPTNTLIQKDKSSINQNRRRESVGNFSNVDEQAQTGRRVEQGGRVHELN